MQNTTQAKAQERSIIEQALVNYLAKPGATIKPIPIGQCGSSVIPFEIEHHIEGE